MPAHRPAKSPRLFAALLAAALGAAFAAPAAAQPVFPALPDACTSSLTPGPVTLAPTFSPETRVFSTPGAIAGKKVVLLIAGNCFEGGHYDELASHYARNGFITGVFDRDNSENIPALFASLDFVLAHFFIAPSDPDLEIALVGHSVGGQLAIEAAELNHDKNLGYPIRAVAALAPKAPLAAHLDGNDAAGFLTLYGSQDEDVTAYNMEVDEAFYAYDTAGTEGSTTCSTPPCISPEPAFERTMVFVYGADHAGMVGVSELVGACGLYPQGLDYLAAADSLCITKAYTTGFLRRHLWNDFSYQGMLRGEWRPLSVASIDTAEADGFGNPAGSPLRLFFQFNPAQKQSIQLFAGGLGSVTKTAGAEIAHNDAGDMFDAPFRVRHSTDHAVVGWNGAAGAEWVRFAVPAGRRDASTFSHFSLRLGQLQCSPSPFDNPVNADQSLWIGLEDANGLISWHQLNGIPAPDRYTGDGPIRAQSHLATRRFRLDETARIDLADVRGVYLLFDAGTRGTLLVDNLEWHRD